MFTYKDVDKLFLYTFIIEKYKFEKIFNLVNKKHDDIFGIMKQNFSRFWYYCTYEEKIKWFKTSNSKLKYYENFNNIIRYSYEVDIKEFDKLFYNGLYFNLDLEMISYKKDNYDDKDMLIMFKQNIVLFWLSLTEETT